MKSTQLICYQCNSTFTRLLRDKIYNTNFCSKQCFHKFLHENKTEVVCNYCGNNFYKPKSAMKRSKSGNSFCSSSCSAKFNNKNKKTGTRRSKIEAKFANKIQSLFPKLTFVFNSKVEGYELDIYLPELKLAIEWNGKVHYYPIYGQDKLDNIKYRDYQKQLICQKLGIDLIIICDLKSDNLILEDSIQKVANIISLKMQ